MTTICTHAHAHYQKPGRKFYWGPKTKIQYTAEICNEFTHFVAFFFLLHWNVQKLFNCFRQSRALNQRGVSGILGEYEFYQNKGLDELYLVVPKRLVRNQPVLNKATKQQRPNTKVWALFGARGAYVHLCHSGSEQYNVVNILFWLSCKVCQMPLTPLWFQALDMFAFDLRRTTLTSLIFLISSWPDWKQRTNWTLKPKPLRHPWTHPGRPCREPHLSGGHLSRSQPAYNSSEHRKRDREPLRCSPDHPADKWHFWH